MDFKKLDDFSYGDLKEIAIEMGLQVRKNKSDLISDIISAFKEYEEYKRKYVDKYQKIRQIGTGKEGTVYLVRNRAGDEYAMKTFRSQKSIKTFLKEADLQRLASKAGVAPKVYMVDPVGKCIVMEKMDRHLLDVMKSQKGDLKKSQQLEIIDLYKKLDDAGVFQGDCNLNNYMYRDRKLYLIDYGLAKEITEKLCKKLDTDKPNTTLGLLAFVLKLKDMKYPETSWKHIAPQIPKTTREKYGI